MLSGFQGFCLIFILLVAFAGGYWPLFRSERIRKEKGLPLGQAFTAGVFLALSLVIMLPNAFHLLKRAGAGTGFPWPAVASIAAFVTLLGIAQVIGSQGRKNGAAKGLTPSVIPVIMTISIAIPSFLLGTALGVSDQLSGIAIFMAIVAHKGSAAFALALSMVKTSMKRSHSLLLFGLFAISTPLGILLGAEVHQYFAGYLMMMAKALILSMASGVFLFMATLSDMESAPLIVDCATLKGFSAMLAGLIITIIVRFLLGVAHTGHPG
jgi:zinc transporter ZupT